MAWSRPATYALVHRCRTMMSKSAKRGWGRSKITWKEIAWKDLQFLRISADVAKHRAQWKIKIHIGDIF